MKRLVRRILIGAVTVGYALVFGEVFLRIFDPQPILPRHVVATQAGIRGNRPNDTYIHRTPEITVEMRINSQGMRADREFPQQPPAGSCRIALVGDSFFLGYEADLPDAIAAQIERHLAHAGYRVDVLNFAVSGFGTAEMIRKFEAEIAGFLPDLVVYQFHVSDFDDNRRAGLFRLKEHGEVQATGNTYLPAIATRKRLSQVPGYLWMSQNAHLYAALRERAALWTKAFLAAEASVPVPVEQRHALTAALIEHSFKLARDRGIEWFLLDIPDLKNNGNVVSAVAEMELSAETRDRIATPAASFAAFGGVGVPLNRKRGHGHLNSIGNDLAARAIVDKILAYSGLPLATCRISNAEPGRMVDAVRRPRFGTLGASEPRARNKDGST